MAQYKDPYSDQQYRGYNRQYADGPSYNQYDSRQPHEAYDQGGYDPHSMDEYRDDPNVNQGATTSHAPAAQEANPHDQYFARETGRQSQNFKSWRYGQTGGLWTRGSRGSCVGRFCCCTLMIAVFFIVGILLALLMWVRPPNVVVGSVAPSSQNAVQLGTASITLNLGVDVAVTNPNYFAVSFSSIDAKAYYPINNTLVGSGNETDITFNANSQKNITFPFSIGFTTSMSSSALILADLATKCGLGGTVSDITINLDLTFGLRILTFVVYPVVNIPVSFACPISASDISSLIPSLTSGLLP